MSVDRLLRHSAALRCREGSAMVPQGPIELHLPFRGRWMAQNSPANRVPSHGTELFGTRFAIDFLSVDERGRSGRRTWRSALATERLEQFIGFGASILAPVSGTVVAALDMEPDHEARRSQIALVPYALAQGRRIRSGVSAVAGNHVVVAIEPSGPFVLLAHLRRGSVLVAPGDVVEHGKVIGSCGNSGNSTEPHVHVQVTDSMSWSTAVGLPIGFRHPSGNGLDWLPRNREIFDAP